MAPPALAQPPLDQRACASPRPDEAAAVKAARECRRTVEITDLTTGTDRAWAEPDGTITWEHRYRPVRVRRGEAWVDVDTTLRRAPGGRVGPRAAAADVTFSEGGTGPLVVLRRGAARFSIGSPFGRLPRPVLSGDTATYENVRPGVDLVVRADVDGVRVRADAAGELRLRTTGTGLTARAGEHGDIRIVDGSGEPVLHGLGASVLGRDLVAAPGEQLSLTLGSSAWSELDSSSPDTARWNAPGPARAGSPAAGTGVYRSVFGADLAHSAVAGRNVVSGRLRVAPAEGAGCAAVPVELWAAQPAAVRPDLGRPAPLGRTAGQRRAGPRSRLRDRTGRHRRGEGGRGVPDGADAWPAFAARAGPGGVRRVRQQPGAGALHRGRRAGGRRPHHGPGRGLHHRDRPPGDRHRRPPSCAP
nr:hypothetical protein GCM10020092_066060 [Actinoplanes digitatis]